MSAIMEILLRDCNDPERLQDCARNDIAMGIAAPPVERDAFFARADLAYAAARDSGELERARDHAALCEQVPAVEQGRMV
jgi:hypothetical protein